MDKKVSVITCAYNRQELIGATVESVIEQSFDDWEMVIVDDGSKDQTADVIKGWQSKHSDQIKYIYQDNRGPGAARNTAIKAACGEYIAVLDSDDLATPDRLEKQVQFLDAHPDIDVVGSNAHVFLGDKKKVRDLVFAHTDEAIKAVLIDKNQFVHSSVMMRKSCLDQYGLYREELKSSQDFELFMRLSQHCKMANMDEFLCWFRLNPGSISLASNTEQKRNHDVVAALAREHDLSTIEKIELPDQKPPSWWQKRSAKAAGHYHWAIRLHQLGYEEEARKFIKIALKLKPVNVEIWLYYFKNF